MKISRWFGSLGLLLFVFAEPAAAQTAGLPPRPEAAATLDQDRFPTAGRHDTLLRMLQPGRVSIKVDSKSGVAIELVDMMTGPTAASGEAGVEDGRIDALLDAGTYKLRLIGADGAEGDAALAVTPFRDARPAALRPPEGVVETGTLADLQQQSFWFVAEAGKPIRIEAAGRSLSDLRLWRDGTDLMAMDGLTRTIEPAAGRPLTDIALEGQLEPGAYLVTAYGGPAATWADGSQDQPFHIRFGASDALLAGWVGGTVGPFGSEQYRIGDDAARIRLDLPQAVPAGLRLIDASVPRAGAQIDRNSRDPVAVLDVPDANAGTSRVVEVTGAAGQPFQLRSIAMTGQSRLSRAGSWWLSAPSSGFGGDELPAMVLLIRREADKPTTVVAGNAPKIGPDQAWRQRFNLRGPSTLLFEVTAPGPITVHSEGASVLPSITLLNGDAASMRDLAAGWYVLRLEPVDGATGIIDLTIGPPGLAPQDNRPTQPADPVIVFGRQDLSDGQTLELVVNRRPEASLSLSARPWPIDLADGPLALTQEAGKALRLSLKHPAGGTLLQTEVGVGSMPLPVTGEGIMVSDRPRNLILSWRPPEAPLPTPATTKPAPLEPLAAGTPLFFDLDRGRERSFALDVPDGGLYRVETLGRMSTAGSIGTAFQGPIAKAEANGTGRNMLLQQYLRAGRYIVSVSAQEDSAGRLAIAARPAPLLAGAVLVPAGSVRAALPAGSGAAFPIQIPADGRYRLEVLGLGRSFTARLEDAEGWPILPAGDLSSLDQDLRAGRYRLVVLPEAVDSRVIARLARIEPERVLEGHGPHPLPFDTEQAYQWREPPGRTDPRTPDAWDFALAGPANTRLTLSDGMVADLRRLDTPDAAVVARFSGSAPYEGTLPAGRYRVEATALGRNDRLDYTLALATDELQPGAPRGITLPATVSFTIASDRVVSLTSFGGIDVKATLRDETGAVLGRYDDRDGDWNIAVSQYLATGRYSLDLAQVEAPAVPASSSEDGDSYSDTSDYADGSSEDGSGPTTELRLALPEENGATLTAAPAGTMDLTGPTVHRLTMPAADSGTLMVAAASSSAELILSLEHRGDDGAWTSVAIDRGLQPVVAVPSDGGDPQSWRAAVWTVDGGDEAIRFAARVVAAKPQSAKQFEIAGPSLLDGMPQNLEAALVEVQGARLSRLDGPLAGLRQGSSPGQALRPLAGPLVAAQSEALWLLGTPSDRPYALTPVEVDPARPMVLDLAAGETATLALQKQPEGPFKLRAWLARSGDGQPGFLGPWAVSAADGAAFAFGSEISPLAVLNAGARGPIRVELTQFDLSDAGDRKVDTDLSETLPPRSALVAYLPQGNKRLRFDLPAGTAAFSPDNDLAWSDRASGSWSLDGRREAVILVNTNTTPAPVRMSVIPETGTANALALDQVSKRFYGAEGTVLLKLPSATGPGHRLVVAGPAEATVIGDDGQIRRGRRVQLTGPGTVLLRHDAGLVAAWIESNEYGPWPQMEIQDAAVPGTQPLSGEAMVLRAKTAQPALLTARTTAPVILAADGDEPVLFPAGAEFHRFVQDATLLRLFSPQDGPLSGSIELSATPVTPLTEGVGAPVTVASGGAALFGFTVETAGEVGIGIRAEPDRVAVRLLDAQGAPLGEGVVQMRRLEPGRYLIEARVPADAPATLMRPAVVGIETRPNGPPDDVVRSYLDLAGLTPGSSSSRGK